MSNNFRLPIKVFKVCFSVLAFCIILEGCGNTSKESNATGDKTMKITIATAANMQFAMKELTQAFTDTSGIECDIVIGSSGNLTAQISEGAPYDVFVAANMKYPNTLYDKGMAEKPPAIYASGRLVLWTIMDDRSPTLGELTTDRIKHIAIANPKLAPYGAAAIEVLQHHNLLEKIRPKLVYGESIAQTNQFITSASAEVGFTAMSVVLSPQMKDKGKWTALAPDTYAPIDQGAIIIKKENSDQKRNSSNGPGQFFEFLFSSKAKEILKDFGYLVYE